MFPTPLDLAPLALFAFGALAFSTLAINYWSARRRGEPGGPRALPLFTLACAVAFLNNLALQALAFEGGAAAFGMALSTIGSLATGVLPALVLQLAMEAEPPRPRHVAWKWLLAALYAGAALPVLAAWNEGGWLSAPWSDNLYHSQAALLTAAGGAGLARLALTRRNAEARDRAWRRWTAALLALLVGCAAASLAGFRAAIGALPDYLLLLFFCITLYYRERLVFFDVLVKRGVFLAAGLALATLAIPAAARWPWIAAAGFLACWLGAPWIYRGVGRAIDRLWLRRSWSPVEAERRFLREMQAAAGEEELRAHAEASLSALFQAPAEIRLDSSAPPPAGPEDDRAVAMLESDGAPLGSIVLQPRPNGIPFLSDDRRLLESLARALSVLFENVHYREERRRQEERERELRFLAGRAELKALRAQINPHFLFNALSVIGGLLRYQPDLADETIEQLAHVFRYALRKSESEWAPLAEEVEFVSAYLRIEQARFGERLRLEFDVDPAAAQIPIPAMSIQPLVENAIKHGVSAVEGRGTVGLRVALDPAVLSIEVFDNGPGFPAGFRLDGTGTGHGLRNVAERLRGYYGDRAGLSWRNGPAGTRVAFTITRSA